MEKEIDRLLKILDNDSYGCKLGSLLNEKKINQSVIQKAKNMGYVRFYNEEQRQYMDFIHDQYFVGLQKKDQEC